MLDENAGLRSEDRRDGELARGRGSKLVLREAGWGMLLLTLSGTPTTDLAERPEADAQHSARLRDRRKRVDGQIPLRDNSQA